MLVCGQLQVLVAIGFEVSSSAIGLFDLMLISFISVIVGDEAWCSKHACR